MVKVTRRTALKSALAAMICHTIELRPEVNREQMLSVFCDQNGRSRYDMTAPFRVGSLTYATDARWMARAELDSPKESGEMRLPPVEQCWKRLWHPGVFRDVCLPHWSKAAIPHDHGGLCPECGNRRISAGESYPSDDDIQKLHDYDYEIDTNTYRDPSCEVCKGRCFKGPTMIEIDGVTLCYWRAKKVLELPSCRVSRSKADTDALLFVADGFEGVLMGLARN